MTKARIALLGSAMMGLLLAGAGLAQAQEYAYDSPSYASPSYANPSYDRPSYDTYHDYYPDTETVIVHPYYRDVEKRQLAGRINGEVNPTEYSLSRSVAFGDLDLSRSGDRMELRNRVHDTASNLCAELDARVPELRGYPSEDRECVRKATQEAMRDVYYRRG